MPSITRHQSHIATVDIQPAELAATYRVPGTSKKAGTTLHLADSPIAVGTNVTRGLELATRIVKDFISYLLPATCYSPHTSN